MGIIDSIVTGVAKEVAKDVTIGVAAVAVDGIDKISNKREAKRKSKVLKTKKQEKSFLISVEEDDKTFWTNKVKARHYTIQNGDNVIYRIKRVVKPEGTSLVEIKNDTGKIVVGSVNEIIKKGIPVEHIFLVSQNNVEIGRVFTNDISPYRFVSSDGEAWDMIQNDKEFLVSKGGKAVAKCKNQGLKLRKHSLAVTYNEDEQESSILYLSMCLFFMLDSIKK